MKHLTLLLLVFLLRVGQAQDNEFKVHTNGLIYSEATMNRLAVIVDSLNIKFRSCDLSKPYYSIPQGFAHYVDIPSREARKLLESGIAFEEYEKKYPRNVKKKNIWIVKGRYADYNDKRFIEYEGLPQGYGSPYRILVKNKNSNDKTKGWIIDEEGIEAFYLVELKSIPLPYEYARLVQYVDCMIDTTATIFLEGAKGEVYERVPTHSKANEFITWAESYPGKPQYPDYDKVENFDSAYTVFAAKIKVWDSLRIQHTDNILTTSNYWKSVLMQARDEAIETRQSDARLEFYVARYLSGSDALQLMRSRKVVGNCSQDQSPRYHAMNICRLAAETAQWDIFLRSHLDIMNDRFERISDGSYAWAGRKTYLKELEELDIPAVDLLLGTTLRVDNVSDNHYFGYIGRTGRALADTEDKDGLEKRLLDMINNPALDPYNRILVVYLFDNYLYNLEEGERKQTGLGILKSTQQALPDYMRAVLEKTK